MKKQSFGKIVLITLLAALLIMQLFRIDKSHPESQPENDFMAVEQPGKEISEMIKTSCYDCHSNETTYPWYSNVAPVSWFIQTHVNHGREEINFSNWRDYPAGRRGYLKEECAHEIEEGDMPLKVHLIIHKEARLSDAEREKLAAWLNN